MSALRAPWGSADGGSRCSCFIFSACALTWFFCFCKESLRIHGFNTAFLSCWFWSVVVLCCSAHAHCQLLEAAVVASRVLFGITSLPLTLSSRFPSMPCFSMASMAFPLCSCPCISFGSRFYFCKGTRLDVCPSGNLPPDITF